MLLAFLGHAYSKNTVTVIDTLAGAYSKVGLSVGPDHLPVAVYSDTFQHLQVLKCGNADCTSGNTLSIPDTGVVQGFESGVLVPADNKPLLAFKGTGSTQGALVVKCLNAECSATSAPVKLRPDYNSVSDFQWILGSEGLPLLNYCADTDIRIISCRDIACSSFSSIAIIGGVRKVACRTRIAIGADGVPLVVHLTDDNNLKVTRCGSPDCMMGNTTATVDSGFPTGHHASIAIGADALPIVSYIHLDSLFLYVLKCGDVDCRKGNSVVPINTLRHPVADPQIGIGKDGLPMVAYNDLHDETLRMLKCGDPACSTVRSNTVLDSGINFGAKYQFGTGRDGFPMAAELMQIPTHFPQLPRNFLDLRIINCGTGDCDGDGSGIRPWALPMQMAPGPFWHWFSEFDLMGRRKSGAAGGLLIRASEIGRPPR